MRHWPVGVGGRLAAWVVTSPVVLPVVIASLPWLITASSILILLALWSATPTVYALLGGQRHVRIGGFAVDPLIGLAPLTLLAIATVRTQSAELGRLLREHPWWVLFFAWTGLTLLVSSQQGAGVRLWAELGFPVAVYLVAMGAIRRRQDAERLEVALLFTGIVMLTVVGVLAAFTPSLILDRPPGGGVRLRGILGANQTSFFFLNLVLLSYAHSLFSVRGRGRWLLLAGIFVVPLVLTGTRITLLALLLGVFLANWFKGRRLRGVVLTVVVAVAVVLLIPTPFNRIVRVAELELAALLSDPQAALELGTWYGRLGDWQSVGMAAFRSSPVWGHGLGATYGAFESEHAGAMHNEYLRLLAETGIVGLVLFLLAMGLFLRVAVRTFRQAREARARAVALAGLACLAGYLVVAMTDIPFNYFIFYGTHVWLLLAIGRRMVALDGAAEASGTPHAAGR
jgi:O-antigen ligase